MHTVPNAKIQSERVQTYLKTHVIWSLIGFLVDFYLHPAHVNSCGHWFANPSKTRMVPYPCDPRECHAFWSISTLERPIIQACEWSGCKLIFHVCLQMTVASNCSNFTSFDLRVKPKTALNRAEVDTSNECSSKREYPELSGLSIRARHQTGNSIF